MHDMHGMTDQTVTHQMTHSQSKTTSDGMGSMAHMGNMKRRFWVALIAAVPVFILSPFMGLNLPFQTTFPGSDWLVLGLSSFLYFYGGQPFLSGAKQELKDRNPAMMTLIAMGISVAYIYSLYAFIMNHFVASSAPVMDFFWELASLIVIMLLGHWIEMNAVMNAGNVLEKMAALLPGTAHVVAEAGTVSDIAVAELKESQTVLVRAGEKIPADGQVLSGESAVNEALVTGESKAIVKTTGDQVIGGAVNGDGSLTVRVTGTGETGYLAQVANLVSQAQAEKSKAETMADRVSRWLFYAAIFVGVVAFFIWLGIAGLNTALTRMVTVLVIACPHALGLAIPLVVARSTSLAAANGLLIRNRQAVEAVKKIDVILMDKTGTLTAGVFQVNRVVSFENSLSQTAVLRLFAGLEQASSHPLATGILTAAKNQNLDIPTAKSVTTIPGVGLKGTLDGREYQIVTAQFLTTHQIAFDRERFSELAGQGNTVSFLVTEDQVVGLVAQGDRLKPDSKRLVSELTKRGLKPVMLTGDNEPAAQKVAAQLGQIEVQANLKPADKAAVVQQFQADGHHVMMVGDGINDAPSLARADVGVAIGAGTDVAIDSADVVLVKSEPQDILKFLSLGRATTRKMVQNLWWGAGYNVVAIPLAAGVLAGIGFVLSPAIGAVVMSLSTVVVAINAMTLHL